MKKCNQCFIEKPITEYNLSTKTKDGRQYTCKSCNSAYHKVYTANRKAQKASVVVQSKVCKDCGLEKPINAFGKRSQSLDKHNIYCKQCWYIRCKIAKREMAYAKNKG